ncbi:SIN3-HDAC complex-associated factor isoform X1 [Tenrec ecaudatus]|uniref:SIN3-HDAC complex-associated factor isoform X1 n=1 Tax=Tenrec ecaudatus TaxID=94439 RepID=UPI003F5A829F
MQPAVAALAGLCKFGRPFKSSPVAWRRRRAEGFRGRLKGARWGEVDSGRAPTPEGSAFCARHDRPRAPGGDPGLGGRPRADNCPEEKMFGFHKPKMYRSIEGCCICRAKSSSSRFTDSKRYEKDFQSCFGLHETRSGDICNACVLLVKRWKKLPAGSKKNWNHILMLTVPLQVPPQPSLLVTVTSQMMAQIQRWLLGLTEHQSFPF